MADLINTILFCIESVPNIIAKSVRGDPIFFLNFDSFLLFDVDHFPREGRASRTIKRVMPGAAREDAGRSGNGRRTESLRQLSRGRSGL